MTIKKYFCGRNGNIYSTSPTISRLKTDIYSRYCNGFILRSIQQLNTDCFLRKIADIRRSNKTYTTVVNVLRVIVNIENRKSYSFRLHGTYYRNISILVKLAFTMVFTIPKKIGSFLGYENIGGFVT